MASLPKSNPARDTALRRSFRGVPAAERQSQRRAALVEAGIEVFGTRGFHASGVRALCEAAKLTERYFYESFDNREALFEAVYQLAMSRVRDAIMVALQETPSADGITLARAALRATLKICRDDPRITRILFLEALSNGAGDSAAREITAYEDMIGEFVSILYPELDRRSVDVELLASGLFGSTLSIVARWARAGFRDPLERVLNHCVLFYESIKHELQHRRGVARDDDRTVKATVTTRTSKRRRG